MWLHIKDIAKLILNALATVPGLLSQSRRSASDVKHTPLPTDTDLAEDIFQVLARREENVSSNRVSAPRMQSTELSSSQRSELLRVLTEVLSTPITTLLHVHTQSVTDTQPYNLNLGKGAFGSSVPFLAGDVDEDVFSAMQCLQTDLAVLALTSDHTHTTSDKAKLPVSALPRQYGVVSRGVMISRLAHRHRQDTHTNRANREHSTCNCCNAAYIDELISRYQPCYIWTLTVQSCLQVLGKHLSQPTHTTQLHDDKMRLLERLLTDVHSADVITLARRDDEWAAVQSDRVLQNVISTDISALVADRRLSQDSVPSVSAEMKVLSVLEMALLNNADTLTVSTGTSHTTVSFFDLMSTFTRSYSKYVHTTHTYAHKSRAVQADDEVDPLNIRDPNNFLTVLSVLCDSVGAYTQYPVNAHLHTLSTVQGESSLLSVLVGLSTQPDTFRPIVVTRAQDGQPKVSVNCIIISLCSHIPSLHVLSCVVLLSLYRSFSALCPIHKSCPSSADWSLGWNTVVMLPTPC